MSVSAREVAVSYSTDMLALQLEGGKVGLDSFFVVEDVRGRNVGGEVVVVEAYGSEVDKPGEGGWDGASEGVVPKVQLGEGCGIAKLRRQ